MAQSHQHYCPNCGTPAAADERFCTNCGFQINAERPFPQIPTQYPQSPQLPQSPQSQQQIQQVQQPGQYYQAPPANQQVPPYAQQPQSKQNPIVEAFAALGLLFLFRRSIRRGYTGRYQRRSSGCCGVLVTIVILGILAAIAYGVYKAEAPSLSHLNSTTGSDSTTGSGELTTQPPITTMDINQTVPYAGVNITILKVQQSKGFLDDPQTQTNGIVRLQLKEQNTSSSDASLNYSSAALLILPDKSAVTPLYEQQQSGSISAGVSRTNWLDFPVPTSNRISQLTLVLGTTDQAQVSIPLTGKADLSQYQTKSSTPNVKTQYAGLTWMVTSAISSLSFRGQQTNKGMLYVSVTLKVDNPTSQGFSEYWGDYIRLKAGDTTSSPDAYSTLPTSFDAGSSGQTGTLYFAMPQGNTSYTLVFQNTQSTQYSPAMVNFQVG